MSGWVQGLLGPATEHKNADPEVAGAAWSLHIEAGAACQHGPCPN
jgi:hypothetical protein